MAYGDKLSGGEKVLCALIALVFIVAIMFGIVALATFLVNFVLAHFGIAPVGMLFVFVCMTLLSWVGSYFRTTTVKVTQ